MSFGNHPYPERIEMDINNLATLRCIKIIHYTIKNIAKAVDTKINFKAVMV
jgi:hypothetical protein